MSFSAVVTEDIRLSILRGLEQDPDYAHNAAVLRSLLAAIGHAVSRDRLHTELAWLEEQALVTLEDVSGVLVARLTTRGEDVALGRTRVPGVKRPGPGD